LKSRLFVASVVSLALVVVIISGSTWCAAEWQLAYSEDWSDGTGGWSNSQSMYPGRAPRRIFVGRPSLANYVMLFYGGCGWGFNTGFTPPTPLMVKTTIYAFGSDRNAFSVNMRTSGGAQIYKYGLGGGNRIIANKQPPAFYYKETDLTYSTRVPYELYSIWVPGTAHYAIGVKNLLTGQDRLSKRYWLCRSYEVPSLIDIDQEGGRGPVALLKVDVYLWR
jgi:hypothetical protein